MRNKQESVNKKYHSINEFNNKWTGIEKSKLEKAENYYNEIKPKCLAEAFDLIEIDKVVILHNMYMEIIKDMENNIKLLKKFNVNKVNSFIKGFYESKE